MINSATVPLYTSHEGCINLVHMLMCGATEYVDNDSSKSVMGQLPNHKHIRFTHFTLNRDLYKSLRVHYDNVQYTPIADPGVIDGTLEHHLGINLFNHKHPVMYLKDHYLAVLVLISKKSPTENNYLLIEMKSNAIKWPALMFEGK